MRVGVIVVVTLLAAPIPAPAQTPLADLAPEE